jgi:hypothetical protein
MQLLAALLILWVILGEQHQVIVTDLAGGCQADARHVEVS